MPKGRIGEGKKRGRIWDEVRLREKAEVACLRGGFDWWPCHLRRLSARSGFDSGLEERRWFRLLDIHDKESPKNEIP